MTSRADAADRFEPIPRDHVQHLFRPQITSLVVSRGTEGPPNLMTANYWMGVGPRRLLLGVEHSTYTYELLQERPEFVLVAPTADMIADVMFCGRNSGRDVDKIDHLGLTTVPAESVDVPLVAEGAGNIEYRVLEELEHDGVSYYVSEALCGHVRPGWFEEGIYTAAADPLLYFGGTTHDGEYVKAYTHLPDEREYFAPAERVTHPDVED